MFLTSIKGGEKAIDASARLVAKRRRGALSVAELSVAQIREQLSLGVDRVMVEGSLYDPTLAALAIKQAEGDLIEAIFLIRAFRTTLPRFGNAAPVDTANMLVRRRISTTHKDIPGGQILGPTYDYTHRLLDFSLLGEADSGDGLSATRSEDKQPFEDGAPPLEAPAPVQPVLTEIEKGDDGDPVADITRDPMIFPARRDQRLQSLARGDEGFLSGLCYSSMRGYGRNHPFVSELRHGGVAVRLHIPEVGLEVDIGEIRITECRTIHLLRGDGAETPRYTRGYGLVFGHSERKALAMAVIDRALRSEELGEAATYPVQDQEFVLQHADNVAASGLVQHLKLPHYVDFQAEMQLLRQLRKTRAERHGASESHEPAERDDDEALIDAPAGDLPDVA